MYNIIERYGDYLSKELYIGSVEKLEDGLDKFTTFLNEHGLKEYNKPVCGIAIDENGRVIEKYKVNKINMIVTRKSLLDSSLKKVLK
jgi:hypothetical protein